MKATKMANGISPPTMANTQKLNTLYRVASGVTLALSQGGDHNAPAVVMLHGVGQTRHAWRSTGNTLVKSGFQVLLPDIRGHGDSDWASDGDYRLDRFCEDLQQIISALPAPPTIVGASLGGHIALAALDQLGDAAFHSLVLVDIANTVNPEGVARIRGFMAARPEGFGSVEEAAAAVARYLPHRPKTDNIKGLRRNLRQRNGRFFWHWDPVLFDTMDAFPEQSQHRYDRAARQTRLPTLLVRGANSELIRPEDIDHLRQLIPHAEYVDVKDARHMVAGDQNDAFSAAVLEFLHRQYAA